MNKFIKLVICALLMLIIDGIWINNVMKTRYEIMVKKIQNKPMKMNYIAAFLAYVFMFIVFSNIIVKYNLSILDTFILGMSLFAVYDFTTGAIFSGWNWPLATIDIIWGGILFTIIRIIYNKL